MIMFLGSLRRDTHVLTLQVVCLQGNLSGRLTAFLFRAPPDGDRTFSAPRAFDPVVGLRPGLDLSALRAFLSSLGSKRCF
jgi:hypothetical protein